MNLKRQISVIVFLSLICSMVYAGDPPSPLSMLKSTANKMLRELRKNHGNLQKNPKLVYRMVSKILIPNVDQYAMARSVVSRNVWSSATITKRRQFVNEFRTLVVHIYAKAISNFKNEKVRFRPIRRGDISGNTATVFSRIIRPGRSAIPITYRLNLRANKWKIVDFSVDGVSMISSFRSQFASIANHPDGLAVLNKKLAKHNARRTNK